MPSDIPPLILVVGPDPALCHEARTQLEAAGMDVIETADEDLAVELADDVDGIVITEGWGWVGRQ